MEFKDFFTAEPMKYYQGDMTKQKAIDMVENKDNKFVATQKRDGNWARVLVDADKTVTIQGRGISKKTGTYTEVTDKVPHIVRFLKELPETCLPLVLIGELAFNDLSKQTNDVGTILRCLSDKAIKRQIGNPLFLFVFDCLMVGGKDVSKLCYTDRLSQIEITHNLKAIKKVEVITNDFYDNAAAIWNEGGEGMVIYDNSIPYCFGKRPAWSTLKLKKELEDLELQVVNTLEPNMLYCGDNPEWQYEIEGDKVTKPYFFGWKNGVVVNNNGCLVSVTSGLTDEDREWLSTEEAAEHIANGTLFAVVNGMDYTADNSIRHPVLVRLRTDLK